MKDKLSIEKKMEYIEGELAGMKEGNNPALKIELESQIEALKWTLEDENT